MNHENCPICQSNIKCSVKPDDDRVEIQCTSCGFGLIIPYNSYKDGHTYRSDNIPFEIWDAIIGTYRGARLIRKYIQDTKLTILE